MAVFKHGHIRPNNTVKQIGGNVVRLFLIIFPLTYSFSAIAICPFAPEHSFKLKVLKCQSYASGFDLSTGKDWYDFEDREKTHTGTLLTGKVTENKYNWRGMTPNKNEWSDVILKTVFINEAADHACAIYKDKEVEFYEVFRCCDTIPAVGICVVPFPIATRK